MPRYRGNVMGLNDVFEFGSHKGSTLKSVLDWRPETIQWYLSNIPNFKISDEAAIDYMKGMDCCNFNDKRDLYWKGDYSYYLPQEQAALKTWYSIYF